MTSGLKVVDGKLDLKSVEELSREALRDWIFARLHGQDSEVPDDMRQGELPHYLITVIYPNLDRHTRQDMENIVLAFVKDLARNPNSVWRGDPADELLLLAQTICDYKVTDYLIEMVQSCCFFDSQAALEDIDLHYRALQSLVALGWRGSPEFWQEQVRLSPDRYAGVAFDGLALIAPEHAIALLPDIPWTDVIEDRILTSLPDFLEEYSPSVILPLFKRHLPNMPERAQRAISEFLNEEGLRLSTPVPIGRNYDPTRNCLRDLGYLDDDFQPRSAALVNNEHQLAA